MAPREATGSFPDQSIMFDYDSVVAAAAAAAQPQQQPPAAAPITNNESAAGHGFDTTENINPFPQHHHQHQHSMAMNQGLHASLEPADHTPPVGSVLTPSPQLPIDPLSIDPTSDLAESAGDSFFMEMDLPVDRPALESSTSGFLDNEHSSSSPIMPTTSTMADYDEEEPDDDSGGDSSIAAQSDTALGPWSLSAAAPAGGDSVNHSPSMKNSQRWRGSRGDGTQASCVDANTLHSSPSSSSSVVHWVVSEEAMETEEHGEQGNGGVSMPQEVSPSTHRKQQQHELSPSPSLQWPPTISRTQTSANNRNIPRRLVSASSLGSKDDEEQDNSSAASAEMMDQGDEVGDEAFEEDSLRMIYRNGAFDGEDGGLPPRTSKSLSRRASTGCAMQHEQAPPLAQSSPSHSPSKAKDGSKSASTYTTPNSSLSSSHSSSHTTNSTSPSTPSSIASSLQTTSPIYNHNRHRHQTNNNHSTRALISLQFGPNTTVEDLKYFAERGCIVALLEALVTSRLVALGTRMLADYAKQASRRVAVASNKRILAFLSKTMLLQHRQRQDRSTLESGAVRQVSSSLHPPQVSRSVSASGSTASEPPPPTSSLYHHSWHYQQNQLSLPARGVVVAQDESQSIQQQEADLDSEDPNWMVAREYAVETIRSLTATEESDVYLMKAPGLLQTLARVAVGAPFSRSSRMNSRHHQSLPSNNSEGNDSLLQSPLHSPILQSSFSFSSNALPMASGKAQLHACIAIMNLSCGKANKTNIAQVTEVLTAMRDVMLGSNDEARLKATTCIKNLSNADANDAALLQTPGVVQALAHVASYTCSSGMGATPCTTNACLALMNLSIAKGNKNRVFCTPGVMESLMKVLEWTTSMALESETPMSSSNKDARIKACSALSNLAIGYDNKIPMFHFPGFVTAILNVIQTDRGEARTKACSILWSFAAEMKNQIPVVQRGDILPVLVQVAQEDETTEARFKCVAALTLLAESLENAVPLLEAGALVPLMDILHSAGADPTRWKGQTASWCVGFLMNIAQSDDAVPSLRQAGVVELLAPLLTLDHYQSLKAAMAVTFCCRFDQGDECYDLLRKTENVIPKIVNLLHNTLAGRGGNGYKYGVFTLRSSVGCIAALALGPDFIKERIATAVVFESLLKVLADFCVDGGTKGAIVGGGREDVASAVLALRAVGALTAHLIPTIPTHNDSDTTNSICMPLPFGSTIEQGLILALDSFYRFQQPGIPDSIRQLALDSKRRIEAGRRSRPTFASSRVSHQQENAVSTATVDSAASIAASMAFNCCGLDYDMIPGFGENLLHGLILPSLAVSSSSNEVTNRSKALSWKRAASVDTEPSTTCVRTFLLADSRSGLRFVVPMDPSGGRFFNDNRQWCYRRGRFCKDQEEPDPNYVWTYDLQQRYEAALSDAASKDISSECTSIQNDASAVSR